MSTATDRTDLEDVVLAEPDRERLSALLWDRIARRGPARCRRR